MHMGQVTHEPSNTKESHDILEGNDKQNSFWTFTAVVS